MPSFCRRRRLATRAANRALNPSLYQSNHKHSGNGGNGLGVHREPVPTLPRSASARIVHAASERYVQGLGGLLLCLFTPPVVARRGRDVRMSDEALDHGDVDPGIEEVGHTGPAQVMG